MRNARNNKKPSFYITVASLQSTYLRNPVFVNKLPSGLPVRGIAILLEELFLVRQGSQCLEVYDVTSLTLRRHLAVSGLVGPSDMASSTVCRCLYVADRRHSDTTGNTQQFVHRVEPNGKTFRWSLNYLPHGLSITADGRNVIVTCDQVRVLKEYTTRGVFVREIHLSDDIQQPMHAVQLPVGGGQFVVCHGGETDSLNRLCRVDVGGHLVKSYGGPPGSGLGGMNVPIRLAVDRSGNVFVVDVNNRRVLLASPDLDDVRELLTPRNGDQRSEPYRICLDELRGLVFVAECEWNGLNLVNGEVRVFKVRDVPD